MRKFLMVAFLGVMALGLSRGEALAECYGEACGDLVIKKSGACIILQNRNQSRQIRVDGPNWVPAYIYEVYPNSEQKPTDMHGACHTEWYEKWNATYKGGSTGMPGGTYNRSCDDCSMQGSILRCSCDGKPHTSLNIDSCGAGRNQICNQDGHLRCPGPC